MHTAFESYRDEAITKWDTKLRLASGKLTDKVCTTHTPHTHHLCFFCTIGFCSSRQVNSGPDKTCKCNYFMSTRAYEY